jgi:small subunit ribosomal protein S24e
MEINIDSKRNNPLLNRTEVHFTVVHKDGKTPNRELVRTELADKLNPKKENIIVNFINPSFGQSESTGYAKIYSSKDKMENLERKYMLNRNNLGKPKKEKPKEEQKTEEKKPEQEKTEEQHEQKSERKEEAIEKDKKPEEKPTEKKQETPNDETKKSEEKSTDQKSDETKKKE